MLRRSRHLQVIAVVIAMTSIGAGLIDQQLSMATEAAKGSEGTDAMTAVLANVQVSTSIIGFVIQVWLTSRIQRFLGIGFALMILPFGLGATGMLMLLTAQLWAPMFARVFDKSIRYTVDKTIARDPVPAAAAGHQGQGQAVRGRDGGPRGPRGQCAHPARADQALGAESLVAANQLREPGGGGGLGRAGAPGQARLHGRVPARASSTQDVRPQELRLAEPTCSRSRRWWRSSAHPDARHVLHAIDLLEGSTSGSLISPLLLHHESPEVRARALRTRRSGAAGSAGSLGDRRRADAEG